MVGNALFCFVWSYRDGEMGYLKGDKDEETGMFERDEIETWWYGLKVLVISS